MNIIIFQLLCIAAFNAPRLIVGNHTTWQTDSRFVWGKWYIFYYTITIMENSDKEHLPWISTNRYVEWDLRALGGLKSRSGRLARMRKAAAALQFYANSTRSVNSIVVRNLLRYWYANYWQVGRSLGRPPPRATFPTNQSATAFLKEHFLLHRVDKMMNGA